jgi:hypothetical protein
MGDMSWPFLMASGTLSGLGTMFFMIGKRREQYLRMLWGACLVIACFVFSSSWPGLILSGLAFTALAWFKPE